MVGALLSRGLIVEMATDSQTRADAALNRIWRNDEDGRAILLTSYDGGLAAIGVEPKPGDSAPRAPTGAERGGPPNAPAEATRAEGANTAHGHQAGGLIEMLRAEGGATIDEIVRPRLASSHG